MGRASSKLCMLELRKISCINKKVCWNFSMLGPRLSERTHRVRVRIYFHMLSMRSVPNNQQAFLQTGKRQHCLMHAAALKTETMRRELHNMWGKPRSTIKDKQNLVRSHLSHVPSCNPLFVFGDSDGRYPVSMTTQKHLIVTVGSWCPSTVNVKNGSVGSRK